MWLGGPRGPEPGWRELVPSPSVAGRSFVAGGRLDDRLRVRHFARDEGALVTKVWFGIESAGDKRYRPIGDLTIHGTTRPVVLDGEYAGRVKEAWGGERAGFTAKTSIDRRDFGLTWNQTLDAGGGVGDKVDLDVEIEAVEARAA